MYNRRKKWSIQHFFYTCRLTRSPHESRVRHSSRSPAGAMQALPAIGARHMRFDWSKRIDNLNNAANERDCFWQINCLANDATRRERYIYSFIYCKNYMYTVCNHHQIIIDKMSELSSQNFGITLTCHSLGRHVVIS